MQKKPPHFDISAAVIRQLGEELVSDEVTAIIELVKNAYDADASYANVIVDTNHILGEEESFFKGTKGYISIADDGFGMSDSDIEEGWLTISLSHKRQAKQQGFRTPKGRKPLGEKGLGRLSTQRLGDQLELFTFQAKSKIGHHVAFKWSDFKEELPLSAVPVHLKQVRTEKGQKGTKFIISKLRDPQTWSGTALTQLTRRLSQLIFPYEGVRPFRIYLTINGRRIDLETVVDSVREAAVARFQITYVDGVLRVAGRIRLSRLRVVGEENTETYEKLLAQDNGEEFFAYLTSPANRYSIENSNFMGSNPWFLGFETKRELKSLGGVEYVPQQNNKGQDKMPPADPGRFYAEIDEFALRATDITSHGAVFDKTADFSQFIKNQAGIRIFRNGFGIRPYGLEGNDWLNLGGGQTSGASYYGLRPQNVLGYVAISEEENGHLQEKTDREGFIQSPYSVNFFLLMNEAANVINLIYNNLRRSYNEYKKMVGEQQISISETHAPFDEMRRASANAYRIQENSKNLEQNLSHATESIRTITEKVDKEPLFTSELEIRLAPILSEVNGTLDQARILVRELRTLLPQAQQLNVIADYLEPRILILQNQLEEFSELAGLGLTAEALSHEIHTIADRLATRTRTLIDVVRRGSIQNADLVTYTEYVFSAVNALRKQISHLAPSLRYVREQKSNISLRSFFEDLKEFYTPRFQELGIQLILEEPYEDFVIRANLGRLTQIFDNLILNSEYWLKEVSRAQPDFKPLIKVSLKPPFVQIEDNGLGVDLAVERSLFQPFVTTKPRNQGRGLGLFITQQLLDSMGGVISLLPYRNKEGRRYIFQVDLSGVINDN